MFGWFSTVEAILASRAFCALYHGICRKFAVWPAIHVNRGERSHAVFFAEEALEAMRNIRDAAWNELRYSQSTVAIASNQWTFSGEGSTDTSDGSTRTITFADIRRNGAIRSPRAPRCTRIPVQTSDRERYI